MFAARCCQGGPRVRSTGPTGPNRLAGPDRPEPAYRPLHAAGARCCAPGAAWLAPDAQLAGPGGPALQGQQAGHGTAGRFAAPDCAPDRRARGHGWRMAGRGLITGGFLLCGWLVTGAGHAYAAQITAPAAPHGILTGIGTGAPLAGPDAARVLQRPASTPLAVPSFPSRAGVGAGNHSAPGLAGASASAVSAASGLAGPGAPAVSSVSGLAAATVSGPAAPAVSSVPGPAASLAPGPAGAGAGQAGAAAGQVISSLTGQVTAVGKMLGAPAMATLPQTAVVGSPPAVQTVGTGAIRPRTMTPGPAGPGRTAAAAAGLAPASDGLASGTRAAHPLARGRGSRSAGTRARRHAHHRGSLPAGQQPPGAATSADPASPGSASSGSAPSGGGAGTGQPAAQAPPGAGAWSPSVRLVRIRPSRWPAGFLRVDDPAVSPD